MDFPACVSLGSFFSHDVEGYAIEIRTRRVTELDIFQRCVDKLYIKKGQFIELRKIQLFSLPRLFRKIAFFFFFNVLP